MELADRVLAGEAQAIARAISVVEDESRDAPALIRQLFPRAGGARVVGVTGAPGVGKSTLVDALTSDLRRAKQRVGVVAVDPTSPFSGGAILGDRIRMQTHAGDAGVYVRSMATRGHLGGLARATSDVAVILDAAGHDIVLIETVGVGQGEIEIVRTADVSIVVTVPGTGDDIQALKAGIMEIADVFVVNKADRDGADRTVKEIEAALTLKDLGPDAWHPPVLKTQATTADGVPAVLDALARFERERGDAAERRRARARYRLEEILVQRFVERLVATPAAQRALDEAVDRVASGTVDPYTAAEELSTDA